MHVFIRWMTWGCSYVLASSHHVCRDGDPVFLRNLIVDTVHVTVSTVTVTQNVAQTCLVDPQGCVLRGDNQQKRETHGKSKDKNPVWQSSARSAPASCELHTTRLALTALGTPSSAG